MTIFHDNLAGRQVGQNLPTQVLQKTVIGENGKERIISPTEIVQYYSANGIGGRTGVVNNNNDNGGGGGDSTLRENN